VQNSENLAELFLAKNKDSRAPAEQFQFLAAQNIFQNSENPT